ncbi:hypothetical protein ACFY19_29135 [Streptosporangium saharense]|uniref:hypothetical protein n=1 Tax=Streptosporangium saharense TaxID=1706840 RepID=UPI003693C305
MVTACAAHGHPVIEEKRHAVGLPRQRPGSLDPTVSRSTAIFERDGVHESGTASSRPNRRAVEPYSAHRPGHDSIATVPHVRPERPCQGGGSAFFGFLRIGNAVMR